MFDFIAYDKYYYLKTAMNETSYSKTLGEWFYQYAILYTVAAGLVIITLYAFPTLGIDLNIFVSAGRDFVLGQNPYQQDYVFLTPIWSMLLFAPMSFVPMPILSALWTIATLAVWIVILRKINMDPISIAIFICNPFFVRGLTLGNYDWLVLVGLFFPDVCGWFFLLKPQVVIGWIIYMTVKGGIETTTRIVTPPLLVLLLSAYFGYYKFPDLAIMDWNWSLGWFGYPLGIAFVWVALKEELPHIALAGSPFLSPYVAVQSMTLPLLLFIRSKRNLAIAVVVSWAIFILQTLLYVQNSKIA